MQIYGSAYFYVIYLSFLKLVIENELSKFSIVLDVTQARFEISRCEFTRLHSVD